MNEINEIIKIIKQVIEILKPYYLFVFIFLFNKFVFDFMRHLVGRPERSIEKVSNESDLQSSESSEDAVLEYILNTPLDELVEKELQRPVDELPDYDYSIDNEVQELIKKYDKE